MVRMVVFYFDLQLILLSREAFTKSSAVITSRSDPLYYNVFFSKAKPIIGELSYKFAKWKFQTLIC